ncbi:MAG TPA: NAD-dependent epimerase/dehydratase family protein [Woeseiaceae bacterium]|nr:NAD-dependent epimerase/dehydratase family protein [Woeseiaceae bacterium]
MSRVLVSGATGFVGHHLCDLLASLGNEVVGTTRSNTIDSGSLSYELKTIPDIGDDVDWNPILDGVDYVVHLAARVHVMRDVEKDALSAFRRVNVAGTVNLLRYLGSSRVKRLIYLSTVKVHGDLTNDRPFSASDSPAPNDPYAQSKLEAEQHVEQISAEAGLETVIIRPPLVYGPGVGGNFASLLKMIHKGIPLPFGLINNSRSLVSVENLCSLICECLTNSAAPGKTFLVSDYDDVSTPELIRLVASSMYRPARLLPVPVSILKLAATMLGQSAAMSRLTGSLQVDIGETMRTLNWKPPVSVPDGIRTTTAWYKLQQADD